MLGTVGRWVEVLTEWNPGLSDASALRVVEAFFGELEATTHQMKGFRCALLASATAFCAQASSCPASRIASTSRAHSRKLQRSLRSLG